MVFLNYNRIIVLLIIIILVAGLAVLAFSGHSVSKEDSVVKILSNSTLNANDSIKIKLTDLSNNPIAGENVAISVFDSNGTLIANQSVKTGNDGEASLNLTNVSGGRYSVNITYEGNSQYNGCKLLRSFTVADSPVEEAVSEEQVTSNTQSSGDSGAYYSEQSQSVVYTGEVELGPDGNYWRHTGNNEWEQVG